MENKEKKMGVVKDIVILHGWTYSTRKWFRFMKTFQDLGYKVSILKIPGLTRQSNKVWDLESYSKWLDKKLNRHKNKVILLGHSNGGRLAIYYAIKSPQKLSKLVLMNSSGIKRKELRYRLKRLLFMVLAKLGKKIFSSPDLKKYLYKAAGETDYYKASENMKQTMKNLITVDLEDQLGEIKNNTIIIWGADDGITPVKDAHLMSKNIKISKLHIIKGAGHAPFHTHPEKTAECIIESL